MLEDGNDLSGNITTTHSNVEHADFASIHITWSGTGLTGEFFVDARNGEDDTWYAIDFGSAISISGTSGDEHIVMNETPFTDIRLRYTASAGTGTATAYLTTKSKGA